MRNLSISLWDAEKNNLWTEESFQNKAEYNSYFWNRIILLWFPHRAVSKTDDLYLLIGVVVILIQFRDAAYITSHFFLLFIYFLDNKNPTQKTEIRLALN